MPRPRVRLIDVDAAAPQKLGGSRTWAHVMDNVSPYARRERRYEASGNPWDSEVRLGHMPRWCVVWTVPEVVRVDEPTTGDEEVMLRGLLEWQRATLLWKCTG